MKFAHCKYSQYDTIHNKRTNEQMRIRNVKYDKRICAITYICSHIRYRFDMIEIPEVVISHNVEKGDMEVREYDE